MEGRSWVGEVECRGIVEGDIAHSNQTTQSYAHAGKVLKTSKDKDDAVSAPEL